MGLGQVLGKLGMQQPHGERHHGAWTEGRDRRGNQGKIKKKQGGMRTGEIGRKRGRWGERKTERAS